MSVIHNENSLDDSWKSVLMVLNDSFAPDTTIQRSVQEKLLELQSKGKFAAHLLYIFENKEINSEVRCLAGILLKNFILTSFNCLTYEELSHIKRASVQLLQDPSKDVQGSVSSLISTVLWKCGIHNWPDLIPFLINLVDKSDIAYNETILLTLLKICEEYLLQECIELDPTVKLLLTKFIDLVVNSNVFISLNSMKIINDSLQKYYPALKLDFNSDVYLNNLIHIAGSENEEIQKLVCQGFVTYLDNHEPSILPKLNDVMLYIIEKCKHSNDEIALQATEFWLSCSKMQSCKLFILPHIDKIVPILITNMRYSANELFILRNSLDNDSEIADRSEDIRPFQKSETFANRMRNDDDDDADSIYDEGTDEDLLIGWTLRKCSASSLDFLAVLLKNDFLPVVLPYLNEVLNSDDYITKESGILALGAIAEGCNSGLEVYLPQLIPELLTCLSHEKAIIRIITCWTLGRFVGFIVSQSDDNLYMYPTLITLLQHIIDPNKRVQHAALSAFCIFQEEATCKLIPYVELIIRGFLHSFNIYQSKSLYLLYDAIAVLAQSVGNHLGQYADVLVPPLMQQLMHINCEDQVIALTECLANVVTALDVAYLPYAEQTFDRCVTIINDILMVIVQPTADNEEYEVADKESMMGALDLLLAMSVTLKSHIVKYLVNSSLPQQLYYVMQDDLVSIRQPALGLFGDIVRLCYNTIQNQVHDFMPIIIVNIDKKSEGACNNAAWVISKLCLAMGDEIKPYSIEITDRFIKVLKDTEPTKTMYHTVTTSLCILGLIAPDEVAPSLSQFGRLVCQGLRNRGDCEEKDLAFRGLCDMSMKNPSGLAPDFLYFCDAAASWNNILPDLHLIIKNLLCSFILHAGQENWMKVYEQFPELLRQRLKMINCPKSLLAPLINITIRKTREKCKLDPRACGFNASDNAYEPLKLMQSVVARCNEICSLYLDNSLLCSLPPPNNHYHRHPVSVCAVKNGRRRMEDRHVVIHDLNTILNFHEDVSPSSYYAVFDGHAGHDAAVYSATHLHQYLGESEHFPNNPDKALTEAFFKTDAYFVQKCEVENFSSGTTAVCVLLRPQEKFLYVAWAGDSMALIANKGRILQCVVPHKPGRKDEQDRITQAGGTVVFWGTWRVNGQLAVSRAIGDAEFKPSVVATPDIQKVALDGGEDFIILACDGLWDFVNDDMAAKDVYTAVCKNPEDAEDVSQGLVKLAKLHGSSDNISIIVVFLRDPCEVAADALWLLDTNIEGTTSDQDTPTAAAAAATTALSHRPPSIAEAVSEAIRVAAAMDAAAGLDNNPFANNDAATTGEHIQKDPFLLDLDSFKQQAAEINSVPNNDFFLIEHSTNGKRLAEDVFGDDDDFGPETNVDGDGIDNLPPLQEEDHSNDNNYFRTDDKMEDQFHGDNSDDDIELRQKMSLTLLAAKAIAEGVSNSNNPVGLLNRLEEEMEQEYNKEEEFARDDFEEENSREKVMEKEDGLNPLAADDVHDGHLVDNVVDSGEESEDEWNYFKGNTPKDNINPTENPRTVDNLEGDDSDMSQLNPNAAEFVPVSPTRNAVSPTCMALLNDTIYAQSPRPIPTERNDIDVPEPNDFESEIKRRPSDICNMNNGHAEVDVELNTTNSSLEDRENLLNGRNAQESEFQPNKSAENFHFGPNATPFSTPAKLLDDSGAFSTKANFGDDSTATYLDNISISSPHKNVCTESNNPFGDQTDFQAIMNKESDPMSMSFYQDKDDKSDTNPFDLNKVQMIPDDLDVFLSKPNDEPIAEAASELSGHDEQQQIILTTDLDKPSHDEDFLSGIREIPKSPYDDIKTPEPTFDENLCPNNEVIEKENTENICEKPENKSINSDINDLCGQIKAMAMDDTSFTESEIEFNQSKPDITDEKNLVSKEPEMENFIDQNICDEFDESQEEQPQICVMKMQEGTDLIECHMMAPLQFDDFNQINEAFSPEPVNQEVPIAEATKDYPPQAIESPEPIDTFAELIQPAIESTIQYSLTEPVVEPEIEPPRPESELIETPVDDITSSIKDDASPVQLPPAELIPELAIEEPIAAASISVAPEVVEESSILEAVVATAAGVAAVAAVSKKTTKETLQKKPATSKVISSSKSTLKVSTATAKVGTISSTKSASKPLKAPIPRTATAKLNSFASNAGKLTAATSRPKTAPSPTKPASDKKPLLNGDTKSTISATKLTATPKPRVSALSLTKKTTLTISPKPTTTKLSPTKPTARPLTAPVKSPAAPKPAGAVSALFKPKLTPSSTAGTSKLLSTTSVTKIKTSSTLSATNKQSTTKAAATALAKPRAPITRAVPPKAPDTEKQNKENVNKQTASRTAATTARNNSPLTNGKPSGTTARKIELKVSGVTAKSTVTKSTATTTNNRIMPIKKPTNDAKSATTKTKITKSSIATKVNNLSNGLADTNTSVVENIDVIPINNANVDNFVVKDNSPIMENSQLINATAAD